MKISKRHLQKIIQEELANVLNSLEEENFLEEDEDKKTKKSSADDWKKMIRTGGPPKPTVHGKETPIDDDPRKRTAE